MKTGIVFLDKKIWTNLEKRTTTVKLDYVVRVPDISFLPENVQNKVYDQLDRFNGEYLTWVPGDNFIGIQLIAVGKSKAKPEDDFDMEFGRHVADDRAHKLAFQTSRQIQKIVYEIVGTWFDRTFSEPMCDRYEGASMKIENLNRSIDAKFERKFGRYE